MVIIRGVRPVPVREIEKKTHNINTICDTIREIYHGSDDQNIKILARVAMRMSKKINARLEQYKKGNIMDADRMIQQQLRVKGRRGALPWMGWNKKFGRDDLSKLFNMLEYKKGAEIGVSQGRYSRVLCDSIPGLELYCVDTWMPYSSQRLSVRQQEVYLRRARKILHGFNVHFLRKTSVEALADVPDGSLDFVYIDALHDFDNVIMDIIGWVPKVRKGGMISGHDYYKRDYCGVLEAVDAYTHAHCIIPWYITAHNLADRTNSWFWVNK